MGITKRKVDNSRTHPLYLAHKAAESKYMPALATHLARNYPDDLTCAKAYRKVLELQLAYNAAYIAILESGVPPIEYV